MALGGLEATRDRNKPARNRPAQNRAADVEVPVGVVAQYAEILPVGQRNARSVRVIGVVTDVTVRSDHEERTHRLKAFVETANERAKFRVVLWEILAFEPIGDRTQCEVG